MNPTDPLTAPDDNARYRLLVDAITDYAVYMLDRSGHVSSWNPGAQRFKGYTADEIIGHHFSRFYTEADRADGLPDRALRMAVAEGRFENEGWRVRKNGEHFWAHVVIDPIRGPGGEVIGFAKVTRDLSERKQAEEQLRHSQEQLEQARFALFQSQKLDALGQLTGGVAHDFNNLLTAVMGSLELLRKRLPKDDPKALSLLNNAVQGAQRGAALTQRMLAFARKQELQLRSMDVRAAVEGMTGLLERSLGPRIALDLDLPGDLPPVRTDPNQFETAILNLAVNARDAMTDGGRITISARTERLTHQTDLPDGRYVRLSVLDSGPGMDAAILARASEPFFTTKGVGKGTGLGLSMVHGFVEQSGGRLRLHSRPGEGLLIEIWLREGDPSADEQPEAAAPQRTAPQPLTVLTVDDDDLVLANTAAMLDDLGHTVITAESAGEALQLLDKKKVDIVVTDHAMPNMTGLQLAAEIEQRWPHLPVILTSGYAELPEGVTPTQRLAKPFGQAALAESLAAALKG